MVAGLDIAALAPPQRRVVHELFAVGARRPPIEPALVTALRRRVEEGTATVAALRPEGARGLRLAKGAFAALDCEGRFVDRLDTPFAPTPAMLIGSLAHRALELDHAGGRRTSAHALVAHAWRDYAAQGDWAGEYLANLDSVEADAVRAEALARVTEFRNVFPAIPDSWACQVEPRLRVLLHRGAIELHGRPDLLLGRTDPRVRRMLLIDLKTGRRSGTHRPDMRFYALLATLKYGVAPFRVATYYLDEADWDAEDVDADALEAAARTVVAKAATAARLTWHRPDDTRLHLRPGPACGWCARAPTCPAKATADAARALADR